jgi:transposase-like protein
LYNLQLERRIYNGKKKSQNNEKEIQLRKLCVQLSAEGKNVTQIHRELNRTRDWVYKWLKRAQSGQSEWYFDQSRAPRNKPGKIGKDLQQAIVNSRIKLAKRDTPETKYAFCGAVAIHQELDN